MALLTADDILNKKFTATKFREGYDVVEVDDFLDEVLNTLRALQAENDDLTAKLATAERRVAELSRASASQGSVPAPAAPEKPAEEETKPAPDPVVAEQPAPVPAPAPVQAPVSRSSEPESATGMLQLAQKLHDDYVRSGQEEGERLISEARSEGERIVREAQETSSQTLSQLEQERVLLERKIDELRTYEREYRQRLKSYLENLLSEVDNRNTAIPPRTGLGTGELTPGL